MAAEKLSSKDITRFDEMVKAGRGMDVKNELLELSLPEIDDDIRCSLAEISRRVGQASLALKILSPLLKEVSHYEKLNEPIRVEYGASLIEIGAFQWGSRILETVAAEKFPQTLLFRSFACFNQWQTGKAQGLLQQFVQSPQLTDYERMIGNLNLASALLGEYQFGPAEALLKELIVTATKMERKIIVGSCYEMLGQLAILTGQVPIADTYLDDAVTILSKTSALPALWARKWKLVHSVGQNRKSPEKFLELRQEAVQLKDFETIRECDFFRGRFSNNSELVTKVFFGTPYRGYRNRMLRILGPDFKLPEKFEHIFGETTSEVAIDLFAGRVSNSVAPLEFGLQPHKLLTILSSDLYKPYRIGTLFSLLTENEIFDPFSSPARVHRALFRLREWLSAAKIPLEITNDDGRLSLTGQNVKLIYTQPFDADSSMDLIYSRIRTRFGSRPFSSKDVSELFDWDVRATQRRLKNYCESGRLQPWGAGRTQKYLLEP